MTCVLHILKIHATWILNLQITVPKLSFFLTTKFLNTKKPIDGKRIYGKQKQNI